MRVAIVGSREYPNLAEVRAYVRALPPDTTIVSGGARGVDRVAAAEAHRQGLAVEVIKADWSRGRAAGPERNREIVRRVDRVVAFWDGQSPGTRSTIEYARATGRPLEIRTPPPAPPT